MHQKKKIGKNRVKNYTIKFLLIANILILTTFFIGFISSLDIIYCGQCLDDQKPLETYGLKDGVTLYLVKRYNKEPAKSPGIEMLNDLTFMKCSLEIYLLNLYEIIHRNLG